MDYLTFINETASAVSLKMGEQAQVSLKTVTKNNNIKLDGITIQMDGENISPTIYLNDYYKRYLNENSIENIAEEVIEIYQENKVKNCINVDFFTDYSNVEGKIAFKLIHFKENMEQLEGIPYIRFMDLAIVFYCLLSSEFLGNATILIHNSHKAMWGKTTEELYEAALANAQRILPVQIQNIEEILKQELGEEIEDVLEWDLESPKIPMYVISNQDKINGAACILYKNVLKDFAQAIGSYLYILPSSIHEMIVVPKTSSTNPQDLSQIVKETNDNHVEREEILSYSVYEYKRKEDNLRQIL